MKIKLFYLLFLLICSFTFGARSPRLEFPYRKFYEKNIDAPLHPSPFSNKIDDDLTQVFYDELLKAQDQSRGLAFGKRQARIEQIFETQNQSLLKRLSDSSISASLTGAKLVEFKDLEALRKLSMSHGVVGIQSQAKYDPTQDLGFCFGRATFIHLSLAKRGVPESQLLKIFVLGKMKQNDLTWNFHMATVALASEKKGAPPAWWVIDGLQNRLLTVEDWMKSVRKLAINQKFPQLRFYTSEARKFQPVFGEYRDQDLHHPKFKTYFDDLEMSL